MQYYNYDMPKRLTERMKGTLEKYFQGDAWGAAVYEDLKGKCDIVQICSVDGNSWTHYANLQSCGDGRWELNSQFNGENEDEMHIYGYFKTFGAAVRNLATKGLHGRKVLEIYK